jgi:hypothetical protein
MADGIAEASPYTTSALSWLMALASPAHNVAAIMSPCGCGG